MQYIPLTALAIAPCLALILFVYLRDKYDREPKLIVILSFILGCLSIVPAFFLEVWLWEVEGIKGSAFMTAFLGTGLVEESCKLFFVLALPFWHKAFNEPFDGIVYCVMVSMGFATIENIMYVNSNGYGVGILRMFTAVPAHCIFGVVMGYLVGLGKFSKGGKVLYIIMGLAAASFLHGAYDYCLMERNIPGLWLGAILSLIVGTILSVRAIKIHRKKSQLAADAKLAEVNGENPLQETKHDTSGGHTPRPPGVE